MTNQLSDAGSSLPANLLKEWARRFRVKAAYYSALTSYLTALTEEANSHYGLAVAHANLACKRIKEAEKVCGGKAGAADAQMTTSSNTPLPTSVGPSLRECVEFAKQVLTETAAKTNKNNDLVYFETVPSEESLEQVKASCLVKGIPFDHNDPSIRGADIFQLLIPMKTLELTSVYSELKASLLRDLVAEVEVKDQQLDQFMTSIDLQPETMLQPDPPLSQDLFDMCSRISNLEDGPEKQLTDVVEKITSATVKVGDRMTELGLLIDDAKSRVNALITARRDASLIAPLRHQLSTVICQFAEVKASADEADQSNKHLLSSINAHEPLVADLNSSIDDLLDKLPSVKELIITDQALQALQEAQRLVGKVDEMRCQRSLFIGRLRQALHEDDVSTDLLTITSATKPNPNQQELDQMFNDRLKKHQSAVDLIKQNLTAQSNIESALIDLNASFAPLSAELRDVRQRRANQLSALVAAGANFEQVLAKSHQADSFYDQITTRLEAISSQIDSLLIDIGKVEETVRLHEHQRPSLDQPCPIPTSARTLGDYMAARRAAGASIGPPVPTSTPTTSNAAQPMVRSPHSQAPTVSGQEVRVGSGLSTPAPLGYYQHPQHRHQQPMPYGHPAPAVASSPGPSDFGPPSSSHQPHIASQSPQPRLPAQYQPPTVSVASPSPISNYAAPINQPFQSAIGQQPHQQWPIAGFPHGVPQAYAHSSLPHLMGPTNQPITGYPQSSIGAPQASPSLPLHPVASIPTQPPPGSYRDSAYSTYHPSMVGSVPVQQPTMASIPYSPTQPVQPANSQYTGNTFPGQEQTKVPQPMQVQPGQPPHNPGTNSTNQWPQYQYPTHPQQPQFGSYQSQSPVSPPRPQTQQQPVPSFGTIATANNILSQPGTVATNAVPSAYPHGVLQPVAPVPVSNQPMQPQQPYFRHCLTKPRPFRNHLQQSQFRHHHQLTQVLSTRQQPPSTHPYTQLPAQQQLYTGYPPAQQQMSNQQPYPGGSAMLQGGPDNYAQQPTSVPYQYQQYQQPYNVPTNLQAPVQQPSHPTSAAAEAFHNPPSHNQNNRQIDSSNPFYSPNGGQLTQPLQPEVVDGQKANNKTTYSANNKSSSTITTNADLQLPNEKDRKEESDVAEPSSEQISKIASPSHVTDHRTKDEKTTPHDFNGDNKDQSASSSNAKTILDKPVDPLTDHAILDQLTDDTRSLVAWLTDCCSPSDTNRLPLDSTWSHISGRVKQLTQGSQRPSQAAALFCQALNRRQDAVTFDFNRIVLRSSDASSGKHRGQNDYINASLIESTGDDQLPRYIITQAPISRTLSDYWLMLFEQACEVVVVLLPPPSRPSTSQSPPIPIVDGLIEGASEGVDASDKELYVPPHLPGKMGAKIGLPGNNLVLRLQARRSEAGWTEHIVSIVDTESNVTRTLVYLVYRSPVVVDTGAIQRKEREASTQLEQLGAFIGHVHTFYRKQRSRTRPLAVICPTGSGPSGILTAASIGISQLELKGQLPELSDLVVSLCQKRRSSLTQASHYLTLAHLVVRAACDLLAKHNIHLDSPLSPIRVDLPTSDWPVSAIIASKTSSTPPIDLLFTDQPMPITELASVLPSWSKSPDAATTTTVNSNGSHEPINTVNHVDTGHDKLLIDFQVETDTKQLIPPVDQLITNSVPDSNNQDDGAAKVYIGNDQKFATDFDRLIDLSDLCSSTDVSVNRKNTKADFEKRHSTSDSSTP